MRSPSPSKSAFIVLRRKESRWKKQSLTSASLSTGDTRAQRREKCVCLKKKKSNERRLPVLRHQINFTLSHLAATVMSFIHPFPCSHGNSAAWSRPFFYICLSLSPSTSLPLSRSQWTQPTTVVQLHPQPHKHPPPSSLLLHCQAGVKKKKKTSRRVGNKKGGGAWIHLMEHTCPEDFVVKKAYFCQGCLWDSNKPDTTESD